jgi:uncharacterized protein
MCFFEAQGFLFAVAVAPDLVPPSDWLPLVLGEKPPPFVSEAHAQAIIGELMALYNGIVEEVNKDAVKLPEQCRFREEILENLAEDAPVSQWSRGFGQGHFWLEESWGTTDSDELDEELGPLLTPLTFFSSRQVAEEIHAECTDKKLSLTDIAELMHELFPEAMSSYALLGGALRSEPPHREPHHVTKVGRNEPCPCGSGKKYKRCCMSATADLMEQSAQRVRRLQQDLEQRMVSFGLSLLGSGAVDQAREAFLCGRDDIDLDGPEAQLFGPWLLYGWIPQLPGSAGPGSKSVAQLYLDRFGPRLSPPEIAFIQATSETPTSFHEVLDVEPGRRLRLRDFLLETELEVFEQEGSETLRVGDVIYSRVVNYNGVALIVDMGSIAVPSMEASRIRERMLEDSREPTPAILRAMDTSLRELYFDCRRKEKPRS